MSRFDPSVVAADPQRRAALLEIVDRGIAAVEPGSAVHAALDRDGDSLILHDVRIDLTGVHRVLILGLGKASVPMARAALEIMSGGPTVEGAVVTTVAEPLFPLEVLQGSHPVPDQNSLDGGRRLLSWADRAGPDDLVIFLVSGGGSALVELPAGTLTLDDLQATTQILLRSGAGIHEVNTVRKHLSAIKGGRLLDAASEAAAVLTLVMSDVVGNDLDVIASGPTTPDPTTFSDALEVLQARGILAEVPEPVRAHLTAGGRGDFSDTPGGGPIFERHKLMLIADARRAAQAAVDTAVRRGWNARLKSTELTGDVGEVASLLVEAGLRLSLGEMLVYAGETTVVVRGPGRGGRNQQLALTASTLLSGRHDIVVVSCGTDGIDGPTHAAGGVGDGTAVARGRALGYDAIEYLSRNDATAFLEAVGDLLVCGPTGTNVGDLMLVCRSG